MIKIAFIAIGSLFCMLLNCVSSLSGGVENGNPVLTGFIHNEQGTATKNVIVRLIPYNNNPEQNDSIAATTLSDEQGKYFFDTVNDGLYNIIGETTDGSLSFIDSITVKGGNKTIAHNIVKRPGDFKGVVTLQPYRQGMVVIILLGTNIYTMTKDTIGNYSSPKIPEGTYRAVIMSTLSEFSDTQITINVRASETTIIDTIALRYSGVTFDTVSLKKFREIKTNLAGTYSGTVTTPWVPEYPISFVIDSNGHYSAYNTRTASVPAFYYGTDTDDPQKKVELVNINANGDVTGSIYIVFDPKSVWHDELYELHFDSLFDTLSFKMLHMNQYGPVEVSLHRSNPDSLPPRPIASPYISLNGRSNLNDPPSTFLDSVTITMSSKEPHTIIYQIIENFNDTNGLLAPDLLWRDDLPYQTYTEPIIMRTKENNRVILARIKDSDIFSGVYACNPFSIK